jgi:hypothetical protein
MTDEIDFSPGNMVLDRDDADADPALVVNCIPGASADEWNVPGGQTVAEANPDYPADASVIVVVFESDFDDDALSWNREEPVALTKLSDSPMKYYSFPAPRLVRDEDRSTSSETAEGSDESDRRMLTDIQHVGESRAGDLREAGYVSAEDIATAAKSRLAEIDGIGETRAETISASAADLLDDNQMLREDDAPDETEETDTAKSRTTTQADTDLSAAVVALSRFLDRDGMEATVADDGQSVCVSKADDSYRVSLAGVEGDGPHRSQLEEVVEKVRAATETTTE